jgi:hypothetical protein
MPYCKYEPQSVLENCICKLYCDWAITVDSLDILILDKTKEEEAYTIDVAVRNSHNLHSTFTKKPLKCTDLKEELIRIWQLKAVYIILLVLSTVGIIPNKLRESLKRLVSAPLPLF